MSRTLTIRLPDELLAWLRETSRRTGLPVSQIVRERLESAKANSGKQRFFRHVGANQWSAVRSILAQGVLPKVIVSRRCPSTPAI